MNETTFEKLEFPAIRECLAAHCGSELGKRLARSLRPTAELEQAREWLAQVAEMLSVADSHNYPPLAGAHDIRAAVQASGSAQPLEAETLAEIADTLQTAEHVRDWLDRIGSKAPAIERLGERVGRFRELSEEISEAVDARGQVRDHASVRLANIRRAIERARGEIKVVFDRILRHQGVARYLQYTNPTFHGDRMVLPLKAEQRGRIQGIIHRVSDSGATLFVEPAESVALNNSILQLREEESKEITRILRDLSRQIHQRAGEILQTVRVLGVLDLVAGKCRYARRRQCICPALSDDGRMELVNARHPLLVELFAAQTAPGAESREVVPIDVRLGDDFDVLMITGPNTGGKTVALKTVGLIALMAQSGIPIPAGAGSHLPMFRRVFVDIGDEQSLQQSLSTFSSHLSNQLTILQKCTPDTLVLIDELGAGTDPDEGAAIGGAIVDEILAKGARAIITTHLSELKALAFTRSRVDNASVEFDVKSLQPTYRLRIGEPGNSNALTIAQRLGMSRRMVALARGYLSGRNQALNKAIEGTLQSRREAESARKAAREAELQAARQKEALEHEQQRLHDTRRRFDLWTAWINGLQPGDEVYVPSLRSSAKIVRMQLHRQRVLVACGAMEFEVPLREIAASEAS